jgi:uncharacterized protein (TIGR02145 family)
MKYNFRIYPLLITALLLIFTGSCKKEVKKLPIVIITSITKIGPTHATIESSATSDNGSKIITRGVCWNTVTNPTIANSKTIDGADTGSYTSLITGLNPGIIYYVRAYATSNEGTGYGTSTTFTTMPYLEDIDGNNYYTIQIGTQIWMASNLRVTHYRNADQIPNITDATAWQSLTSGAYCYYNNVSDSSLEYGKIYNDYTVVDSRNLCPAGWHIPTETEWQVLVTYLGGDSIAGAKLKETGTIHWESPNTGATNETEFYGIPAGSRLIDGTFQWNNTNAGFWSSSANDSITVIGNELSYSGSNLTTVVYKKNEGHAVRCMKN